MKAILALLPLIVLVACQSPEEQAKQQAADEAQCQVRGYTPGTDAFGKCLSGIAVRRTQANDDALERVREGTTTVGEGRPGPK